MLVASLLLFSGVANAYCRIDEAAGRQRVDAVSAAHVHEDGMAEECPGSPDPIKEDAKPHPQWDWAPGWHASLSRAAVPAPRAAARIERREPIVESVFRRFPRLLN